MSEKLIREAEQQGVFKDPIERAQLLRDVFKKMRATNIPHDPTRPTCCPRCGKHVPLCDIFPVAIVSGTMCDMCGSSNRKA
jgi:hypothetical protein